MKPPVFLTAKWRYLAMLNYEVDPELVRPLVPRGVELDSWNGKTFVSMVGFMMEDVRVWGLSIPFHQNFEEVNLRFYVGREGPEGWRRGVAFIKEIVPSPAVAVTARLLYNEQYVALPMRHSREPEGDPPPTPFSAEYGWRFRGEWNRLRATATGQPQPLAPGSQEEFIAEHYWGYAAQRDGSCMEYEVEHPPWRVWQVTDYEFDCDVLGLYGDRFGACLAERPSSVFLAEGSEVLVRRGLPVPQRPANLRPAPEARPDYPVQWNGITVGYMERASFELFDTFGDWRPCVGEATDRFLAACGEEPEVWVTLDGHTRGYVTNNPREDETIQVRVMPDP